MDYYLLSCVTNSVVLLLNPRFNLAAKDCIYVKKMVESFDKYRTEMLGEKDPLKMNDVHDLLYFFGSKMVVCLLLCLLHS